MQGLVQIYGRTLSAIFCLLAAIWVLGLIVVPQLFMVERSLWWKERGADEIQLSQRIDQLYNDVTLWQMDLAAADEAAQGRAAGQDRRGGGRDRAARERGDRAGQAVRPETTTPA